MLDAMLCQIDSDETLNDEVNDVVVVGCLWPAVLNSMVMMRPIACIRNTSLAGADNFQSLRQRYGTGLVKHRIFLVFDRNRLLAVELSSRYYQVRMKNDNTNIPNF
jgi:hypothetical protein